MGEVINTELTSQSVLKRALNPNLSLGYGVSVRFKFFICVNLCCAQPNVRWR